MKVSEIPKKFLPLSGFYLKFPVKILLGGGCDKPPHPPGRDAPGQLSIAKELKSLKSGTFPSSFNIDCLDNEIFSRTVFN